MSLAGGHGTAIAWVKKATAAGLPEAELVGIAFATFGLVAGGVIGGPIAELLIKRNNLAPTSDVNDDAAVSIAVSDDVALYTLRRALMVMYVFAVCLSIGDVVNRWLFNNDIKLPGFLTSMMVGILVTNLADRWKRPLRVSDYDAAVMVAGFCGLGMGATPVAMANMTAVTSKYGESFKAFLVIPLVGAFFIDLLNALVIKFFIGLPIMQQAASTI